MTRSGQGVEDFDSVSRPVVQCHSLAVAQYLGEKIMTKNILQIY